jgi:regulatory protein
LREKLAERGCGPAIAETVIRRLQAEGLQSDPRFAEAFVRMRQRRGYGPFRIRRELSDRGINDEVVARVLNERSAEWMERLRAVRRKKFGGRLPRTYEERAKQARFLQYRGFTLDQIQAIFSTRDVE